MMAKGEVVMITGASAGVGRACAVEFAKRGCRIGLFARGIERLREAQRDVQTFGGEAIVLEGDVADQAQLERAAVVLNDTFGDIDIWVNNAMTTVFSEFLDIDPEDFRRVTDVTYHGYVNGTRSALRRMIKRDKGVIVQVGSALSYRSIPLQSAYCGAKHAIQGFNESVRCELLHQRSRVRVTMVHLPAVNTPQFDWCKNNLPKKSKPVAPIIQPEVAARGIVWAAYHRRRELFVGANTVIIVWGNRFFPGVGDMYLGRTGYRSQMRPDDEQKDRPFNLRLPVRSDAGSHGSFDDVAESHSGQLWFWTHPYVAFGLLLLGVLAVMYR